MASKKRPRRNVRYTAEQVIEKLFKDQFDFDSDSTDNFTSESTSDCESPSTDSEQQEPHARFQKKIKTSSIDKTDYTKYTSKRKTYRKKKHVKTTAHQLSSTASACSSTHDKRDLQYQVSHAGTTSNKQIPQPYLHPQARNPLRADYKHDEHVQTSILKSHQDNLIENGNHYPETNSKHPEYSLTNEEPIIELELDKEPDETDEIDISTTDHDIQLPRHNETQNDPFNHHEDTQLATHNETQTHPSNSYQDLEQPPNNSSQSDANESDEEYYAIQQRSPQESVHSDDSDTYDIELAIENFPGDRDYPEDELWERLEVDTGPSCGPFTTMSSLNIDNSNHSPESFFEALCDSSIFERIADQTNNYARRQIQRNMDGMDPFAFIGAENYR